MITIYKLIFPDGRVYIGQTHRTLEERFDNGFGYLCFNSKIIRNILSKAIVYYGWKNIKKEELFKTDDPNVANEKETFYINELKSNETKYGFNTQSGGKIVYKFNSDFTKSIKGIHRSINTEFKMGHSCFTAHPIYCINNKKIYMTQIEAEKDLNTKLPHITEVCKGIRKHTKGYVFRFVEDVKNGKQD